MNTQLNINQSTNQFKISILGYTNVLSDEINQLRNKIIENFNTNLYYKSVYKNLDDTKKYDIWIFDGRSKEKKIKKFQSYPYPTVQFKSGDYISYTDDSGNYQIWLIIDLDQTNEWEVTGEIRQCVYDLKWQNESGEIVDRWCTIDTASVGDGLQITDVIRALDGTFKIKLPFDKETKLIKEDKRFLIDVDGLEKPHAYKTTMNNMITQNFGANGNIVELTVTKDPFKPNGVDNAELMIADYFIPSDNPNPPTDEHYSVIACSNPLNQISIGGAARTLSPTFYDNPDTENTSIVASWTYVKPTGFDNQIVITPSGNNVKIKALDNTSLIGKTVTATVSDGNNDYVSSIVITIIAG
jgi:hypothetical protein